MQNSYSQLNVALSSMNTKGIEQPADSYLK